MKLIGASAIDSLALQDGNKFYIRTPYGPDKEIPWEGSDPELMRAALFTKWGFEPVDQEIELGPDEAALIEKTADGTGWRVVEKIKMDE